MKIDFTTQCDCFFITPENEAEKFIILNFTRLFNTKEIELITSHGIDENRRPKPCDPYLRISLDRKKD